MSVVMTSCSNIFIIAHILIYNEILVINNINDEAVGGSILGYR